MFSLFNSLKISYYLPEGKLRLNKVKGILQISGSQSVVPGLIILASPSNLLEIQNACPSQTN